MLIKYKDGEYEPITKQFEGMVKRFIFLYNAKCMDELNELFQTLHEHGVTKILNNREPFYIDNNRIVPELNSSLFNQYSEYNLPHINILNECYLYWLVTQQKTSTDHSGVVRWIHEQSKQILKNKDNMHIYVGILPIQTIYQLNFSKYAYIPISYPVDVKTNTVRCMLYRIYNPANESIESLLDELYPAGFIEYYYDKVKIYEDTEDVIFRQNDSTYHLFDNGGKCPFDFKYLYRAISNIEGCKEIIKKLYDKALEYKQLIEK